VFLILKKYKLFLFGILLIISLLPFSIKIIHATPKDPSNKEMYNPKLLRLNSTDKMIGYIDSLYNLKSLNKFDTGEYVHVVSETVKDKFYFGLSNYDISENWIANACGKLIWSHFSGLVNPSDILKHPNGLCSQQTIVFMEILKRKGIIERSVGLGYKEGPGHFLCEVFYNNSWHLYDVTMEPVWKNITNYNNSLEYYLKNKDSLYLAYQNRYSKPLFNKLLEKVSYGKANEFPAKKMLLFHQITLVITYLLPLLFLFMFLKECFIIYKLRKKQKIDFKNINE